VTYVATLGLVLAALALAYARRRNRPEAVTILVVAIPLASALAVNATSWYDTFRKNRLLDEHAALVQAPPVVENVRNLPLAEGALASITPHETFAIVYPGRELTGHTAAGRKERARRTYESSWLQYWLAPRVRVYGDDADWLVLIDANSPPPGAIQTFRFGDDLMVRRR
jgi:hypothetical protein